MAGTRFDELSIRPAVSVDVDAINAVSFTSKAYWGYSAEFLEKCRDELTLTQSMMQSEIVLVTESRGVIVAVAGFAVVEPELGEIMRFLLLPNTLARVLGQD